MNAHVKPQVTSRPFDIESATAELCSLVLAIGQLQSESDMQEACGFLLNIANRTAREIESALVRQKP
jgi:hypothetical protein